MEKGISFKEAMAIIDAVDTNGNAIPFDVSFRTLNRNSKTGGRLITYKQVKKTQSKLSLPSKSYLLHQVTTPSGIKRKPNHFKNRTRNVVLQNGEKRKIHIRLITSINSKKMHY